MIPDRHLLPILIHDDGTAVTQETWHTRRTEMLHAFEEAVRVWQKAFARPLLFYKSLRYPDFIIASPKSTSKSPLLSHLVQVFGFSSLFRISLPSVTFLGIFHYNSNDKSRKNKTDQGICPDGCAVTFNT